MEKDKTIAIIGAGCPQCLPAAIQRALRDQECGLAVPVDMLSTGPDEIARGVIERLEEQASRGDSVQGYKKKCNRTYTR